MAESLYVAPSTVRSQIKSIYRKLGVSSRGAAVEVARGRGLV
jgi:LuxR family transcriptional regulator, maltose regulon positive regulatory protein